MRIQFFLGFLFLGLAAATPAKANFYVEPYFGYETGELDYGSSDDDTKGMVYGFRLGYKSGNLGGGFDYGAGSVEVDSNPEDDFEIKDMGAFVIYDLGAARIWATYIFDAKGELDDAGTEYSKGTGLRLGVGFDVSNKISLNIEKVDREYKKVDNNTVTPKREMSSLVFSVSVPLP